MVWYCIQIIQYTHRPIRLSAEPPCFLGTICLPGSTLLQQCCRRPFFCERNGSSSDTTSPKNITQSRTISYYSYSTTGRVKLRSALAFWIDPDFRERSLTKRFVPVRALSFYGIIKKTRSQQL